MSACRLREYKRQIFTFFLFVLLSAWIVRSPCAGFTSWKIAKSIHRKKIYFSINTDVNSYSQETFLALTQGTAAGTELYLTGRGFV